jgi:hypothetical protein
MECWERNCLWLTVVRVVEIEFKTEYVVENPETWPILKRQQTKNTIKDIVMLCCDFLDTVLL